MAHRASTINSAVRHRRAFRTSAHPPHSYGRSILSALRNCLAAGATIPHPLNPYLGSGCARKIIICVRSRGQHNPSPGTLRLYMFQNSAFADTLCAKASSSLSLVNAFHTGNLSATHYSEITVECLWARAARVIFSENS